MWTLAFLLYVVAYGLALFIYGTGTYGWLHTPQDPLAGMLLAVIGWPTTLLLDELPEAHRSAGLLLAPLPGMLLVYAVSRTGRTPRRNVAEDPGAGRTSRPVDDR